MIEFIPDAPGASPGAPELSQIQHDLLQLVKKFAELPPQGDACISIVYGGQTIEFKSVESVL